MEKKWWKEAVVYQIYPRSYNDTTGNGLGDLSGIIEKLDYIQSLGVTMIWICPVYVSPNDDNGYDISDYRKISVDFGGNETFDLLLKNIHSRGLKLIMDLVVNHSSDEHFWFQEAKKSKSNPYHDYYIWKEGDKGFPPNNWQSVFNGSTWKWNTATEEYFFHLYTQKQPDLNWENPIVREEIYAILDFWLAKGVDGFRMDVISLISKRQEFDDVSETLSFIDVMEKVYANGPRVHEFLKEMNRKVLSNYDVVIVGEGPGVNLVHGPRYVAAKEKELNMIFHFDHLTIDFGPEGKYDPIPLDLVRFKTIFREWDEALAADGWNSIFLGNHDFSRIVSRFGNDKEYHVQSAKLLITLLMTLRGTPYVYQGDEIGMTNIAHASIEDYDDIESQNAWQDALVNGKNMNVFLRAVHCQSRDNARTPMQWDQSKNGGFSSGNPWIPINENYKKINVAVQENESESILHYYRKLIAFRKENVTLVYGNYEDLAPQDPNMFFYKRWDDTNEFVVVHNFSSIQQEFTNYVDNSFSLLMSNYMHKQSDQLNPWESRVYFRKLKKSHLIKN